MTSLCVFFAMTHMLHADVDIHYYDVEQGLVEYEILGGTQLTNETNLNIQGTSKLRFKNWGNIRQEEDQGMIVTKGAINYVQEVKRLEKHIDGKVFTVDYANEQILEHAEGIVAPSLKKETEGLLHRGQDVVAGVLCSVWIGPSIKKCIYKGILLKQESEVLGVSYMKQATKAIFDINTTADQCVLPDFPKNTFGLFKDNMKTKKASAPENVCKVFKDVIHEVDAKNRSFEPNAHIDSKKRKKFINKIAKGIFEKQQEILPELLVAMKKSRECLQLANDIFEKEQCIKNYATEKNALGIEEEDYTVFDNEKQIPLDAIEDAIIDLEPRMACVKRAQNFIDISSCMK
jgi:predicted transcriptional regulator